MRIQEKTRRRRRGAAKAAETRLASQKIDHEEGGNRARKNGQGEPARYALTLAAQALHVTRKALVQSGSGGGDGFVRDGP